MSALSLGAVAVADLLVLFGYPFQTADLIGAGAISVGCPLDWAKKNFAENWWRVFFGV